VNRPKMKIGAALLAMFLFGGVTGVCLSSFLHPYFFSPPHREELQKHMLEFWTRQLDLTPDQQAKVKPIADDFAQQAQTLREQSVKQFSQLADTTDARLGEFLTADQKVKLAQMIKMRHDDFGHHGFDGPGPGDHMGPPPDHDGPPPDGGPPGGPSDHPPGP